MNYVRIYDDEIIENKEEVKLDFTFLTEDQTFGDNQLGILKKYGTKCAITDFAILLGGYVSDNYHTSEGENLKDRNGWWWLQTPNSDKARVVYTDGNSYWNFVNRRDGGGRPVLPYSSISSILISDGEVINEIFEVQYGEYPQTIVDENYSQELENAYNNGSLITSGKTYTTDSVGYRDYDTSFKPRTHTEYEYKGSKYIRFVADSNCDGEVLSDGRKVEFGKAYWIKVEPITWLVDEEQNLALSKKILFSGVQFKNKRDYTGDFDKCDIKQFMDNCFSKDIMSDKINYQNKSEIIEEKTIKQILENGIKEMGEVLGECSDLINNGYQKKIKK